MNAMRVNKHAEQNALKLETIAIPKPSATQVQYIYSNIDYFLTLYTTKTFIKKYCDYITLLKALITIKAAGVNPVDQFFASGSLGSLGNRPPYTSGLDGAGIVEEVGNQCTKFKVHKTTNSLLTVHYWL